MNTKWIITGLLALLIQFKTEEPEEFQKSRIRLLTQKEWKLVSIGYDNNSNGLIDAAENKLRECQEDDTYVFWMDGTASFSENRISCCEIDGLDFTWKLFDHGKSLELEHTVVTVLHLDDEVLVLSSDEKATDGSVKKYINVFKH